MVIRLAPVCAAGRDAAEGRVVEVIEHPSPMVKHRLIEPVAVRRYCPPLQAERNSTRCRLVMQQAG